MADVNFLKGGGGDIKKQMRPNADAQLRKRNYPGFKEESGEKGGGGKVNRRKTAARDKMYDNILPGRMSWLGPGVKR